MELRHLRYFVAVAEESSFSRASGRLYVTQPALSQQVHKLETELGVELFRREGRRVELTEAGEVLLEDARRVLAQLEQTVRRVREVSGVEGRLLRVSFPEYANHTLVADVLQVFRKRHPNVELEEHEMFLLQQTPRQVVGLRDGTLDVGFLLLPVEDAGDLALERVLGIELVAALPEGHPLAARREVPVRALAGERLILFSRKFHPNSYDYIVDCCREAGFEPNVVQRNEPQLYSGATTYRMVASGAGVGVVAMPMVAASRPVGVVFRPLREPTPVLQLAAAWRREDPSPSLGAFLEVVRELVREEEVRAGGPPPPG